MVEESEIMMISLLKWFSDGGVDPYSVVTKLLLKDRERILNAVLDLLDGVTDLSQLEEIKGKLISALEVARSMRVDLPRLDLVMKYLGDGV